MPSLPPARPWRIIVADDHEWIRQILVDVARQTLPAAEVVVTEDGLQALHAHERQRCDFLVTNHNMPNLNGMDLIRCMREQTPALPILMVSVKPAAEADAMAAGANWFLTKTQIMEHMPGLLLAAAAKGGHLPA